MSHKLRIKLVPKTWPGIRVIQNPVPAHWRYYDALGFVVGETAKHYCVAVFGWVDQRFRVQGWLVYRRTR